MYKVDCPKSDGAWQPIDDDNLRMLSAWMEDEEDVIDYVSEHTGWNGSLSNMANVADNLMNIKMLDLEMPDWVANPTLDDYDEDKLYEKILEFAEAHQIACANYDECRDIMGGYWLNHIVETLKSKRDGESSDKKIVAYASHTEITLSVMKLMNFDQNEVPTSAGFILEYKNASYPAVRLIFHEPVENNPDEHTLEVAELTKNCEVDGETVEWCPLETFLERMSEQLTADWEDACGVEKCEADKKGKKNKKKSGIKT